MPAASAYHQFRFGAADEQKKLTDSGGMPETYELRSVCGIS